MFQYAVERLSPLFPPEHIIVATKSANVGLLASQTPALPLENFLVEPEGRGTAPAIGLAAIHLFRRDPEAVMAVLTADHYISDTEGFRRALAAAEKVAQTGYLVTLGINPSSPATGYGYIRRAERLKIEADLPVFHVERFVEKPSLEDARRLAVDGDHSWNSGMFIWRVDRILPEFKRQMPEFYAQLSEVEASLGSPEYASVLHRIWPQVKEQTIDYGVMEGARDVAVMPIDIGWTDVGSWSSLFGILPMDADGNIFTGPHETIDTRNTLVIGEKRLVATIGLEGMVIVDTEDALLICSREHEQDVREIVKRLKQEGRTAWV